MLSQDLVNANQLFGHPATLASRIFTECYATDSFQNILFPLLLFPTFANSFATPKSSTGSIQQGSDHLIHLTIISHAFKRHRFMDLHLPALYFPTSPVRFKYIGIDSPMDEAKRAEAEAGELSRGVKAWEQDPYGVGKVLAEKRRARGWRVEREQKIRTRLTDSLDLREKKDVLGFLDWSNDHQKEGDAYPGILPWS